MKTEEEIKEKLEKLSDGYVVNLEHGGDYDKHIEGYLNALEWVLEE